jgi:hypothetical protein
MGTLSSVISKVRLRIREKNTQYFSNDDFISLANDSLKSFYGDLRGANCKAILTSESLTLAEGIDSHILADKDAIMSLGVISGQVEILPRYDALYPDRFSYIESATGITFYNHSGGEEIVVYYWTSTPTVSAVGDSVPWGGEWDEALMWSLIMEAKMIRQHKVSEAAIMMSAARERALTRMVEKYGTVTYSMQGGFSHV